MVEIMKNKKITYFFQNGRKSRIDQSDDYAKEMFYGYHYFKNLDYETEIVEFGRQKTVFGKYFFLIIEKNLRNFLKLPLYWSFITNKKNYEKITKSNYLIFSNNRMACSAIPMIIMAKIFRKSPKSLSFVMGLFSRNPKYKLLKFFQNLYVILTLKNIDKFIFLSEGEFKHAIANYPKFKKKFHHLPFAVDLEMWNSDKISKNNEILFVGNDGNRDFALAEIVSKNLSHLKFNFVSEEISKDNLSSNSQIFAGSWGNPKLSDAQLKNLYQKAKLTIIPLKESLQPSGQSVALQSIACGTPVLITKTAGFWDNKNFKDKVNIFFALKNDATYWVESIKTILNLEPETIDTVITNGINTVKNNYDLNEFSKVIEKILIE